MRWQNQRTPIKSGDPVALLETHRSFHSVQEHWEETLIYGVDVVICNAMKRQRTSGGSGDLRAILKTNRSFLSGQEHREETSIYDVEVGKSNEMTKSKNTRQIWWSECSFWDLLVPSRGPFGGILGHRRCLPVWHVEKAGKQRHCRKTGSGRSTPEPGGNLE